MMEPIDKLDRIGWIVYVGSVAAMFFLPLIFFQTRSESP